MQIPVLLAFLGLSLIVLSVMGAIALSTRGRALPQADVQAHGYALRRIWFFVLIATIALGLAVTLPRLPYAAAAGEQGARHITVVTEQFAFEMPAQLPLDTPLVFDVSAKDVNHGFGIYDPHERLIAQVQAMPGYVNHLAYTFHEAGRYTVRCLEFCGVGHAAMKASFLVQ